MKATQQRGRSPRRIEAIDLFCGVGGLTHGLIRGGVQVVAGVDVDHSCRYPYEMNNEATFIEADVRTLRARELNALFDKGAIRLLAGCAPCQPFSTYSRKGRAGRSDLKWALVAEFARIAAELKPELITVENVPQLADHAVFHDLLGSLKAYHVFWSVVECAGLGIPQTRKRLVLLASTLGPISLKGCDAPVPTVRQAIGHLPAIAAGGVDPSDPLHTAPRLSTLNLKRIRASRPGGTWRDWSRELRASCHRRQSGQTYPSVYGRMEWDQPAPTITTQCFGFGNGRFGHPEQHRAISLREAAILQTFPDDYRFIAENEKVRFSRLGRLIGNAVPVRLGEAIAENLHAHARDHSSI